jgi:flagellar hook assembly protein FlgD
LIVEEWTDAGGIRLVNLGVELRDLAVDASDAVSARLLLTDRASVTVEVRRLESGRVVLSRDAGTLGAGRHSLDLTGDALAAGSDGDYVLRLTARSSYGTDETDVIQTPFTLGPDGARLVPARPVLLGSHPNPFVPATRIAYALPDGDAHRTVLRIFDARGRLVRSFSRENETPGFHELLWDGTDVAGRPVSGGVYFYTLRVDDSTFDGKLVRVR